jgi:hypothetical protein
VTIVSCVLRVNRRPSQVNTAMSRAPPHAANAVPRPSRSNIEDASGTVIDYSNDSLGSLSSGQQAALEFVTYEGAADTAQLTDVSCY